MKHTATALPKTFPGDFESLVRMHPPRAIHNETELKNVQKVIDRLTSTPRLTSGQKVYLETLTILLEEYAKAHSPFPEKKFSGVMALEFLMAQYGLHSSDLGRLLGNPRLGEQILKGERRLSKTHLRKICEEFQVGPELFFDLL